MAANFFSKFTKSTIFERLMLDLNHLKGPKYFYASRYFSTKAQEKLAGEGSLKMSEFICCNFFDGPAATAYAKRFSCIVHAVFVTNFQGLKHFSN